MRAMAELGVGPEVRVVLGLQVGSGDAQQGRAAKGHRKH